MGLFSNTLPSFDTRSLSEFLSGFERHTSNNPVFQPTTINNSYVLETTTEPCLFCLFEEKEEALAENAVALLDMLHAAGIPGSKVIPDRGGNRIGFIQKRPVILLDKPPGRMSDHIEIKHCAAAGALLGALHASMDNYQTPQEVVSGVPGLRDLAAEFVDQLSGSDASLLKEELQFQSLHRFSDLPRGVVHDALSRESILFNEGMASGILGLERMQAWGPWLGDLAHAVVDLCSGQNGDLDKIRTQAMLKAYHERRTLKAIERGAWPVMLRATAFRRWLKVMATQGISSSFAQSEKTRLLSNIKHQNKLQQFWP